MNKTGDENSEITWKFMLWNPSDENVYGFDCFMSTLRLKENLTDKAEWLFGYWSFK